MLITTPNQPTQHQSQPDQTRSGSEPAIWLLGPLPPPVTGMTLLTSAALKALESAGNVRSFNWSPGMPRRTLWMRVRRNLRMLRSLAQIVARGRVRNERLYLVANSSSGLYLTCLLVFVASRLGHAIYLHHHVYSYIDAHDWRMAWIVRHMGPRDVHVVHAAKMIADFRNRYPTQSGFMIVCPSIVVAGIGKPRESSRRPLRLGLLSNLSTAKGLGEAIGTFVALAKRGRDISLTLAGPVPTRESQRLIDQTITAHLGYVRNIGPVYGDDKARFFADIDVFLFPTKTESWGLVLNEALAAGVPVIAVDRGCTANVVGTEAGLLLAPNVSFVEPAAKQIEQWMDDNEKYRAASRAAIAQAERLHREGQRSLADFVDHMFSAATPATSNGADASL